MIDEKNVSKAEDSDKADEYTVDLRDLDFTDQQIEQIEKELERNDKL